MLETHHRDSFGPTCLTGSDPYALSAAGLSAMSHAGNLLAERSDFRASSSSLATASDRQIDAWVNAWTRRNRISPATVDLAGNTPATAYGFGLLTNESRTFTDAIGGDDLNDYYRFRVDAESTVTVALTGLSADADLQLIQDRNNNGLLDVGEVITYSNQAGNQSENLNIALETGRYYVRVLPYSGSTTYSLSLSVAPVVDTAGNTLPAARDLGTLNGTQTLNDFISTNDTDDYYRFTLNGTSSLNLSLTNLLADLDLQLIQDKNNNGVVDAGEILDFSAAAGNAPDEIETVLTAGTYFVRVLQYAGNSSYTLTLAAEAAVLPAGYDLASGYGLVNAGSAVAAAIGQSPFGQAARLGGGDWALDSVRAPDAWAQGYTGQNIVVAVIDTGVDYNHTDLDGNIWVNTNEIAGNGIDDDNNGYIDDVRGWDFASNDNNPMDLNGHGTHVAGTIAAERNGSGTTGVAYNARIMPIRVLGADGSGTYANVAAGIRYAANNGARVINLSLGGGSSQEVQDAIAYAAQRGVFVVMSAGNAGAAQPGFPANIADQYGVAVGAVDLNNQMPAFSNRAGFPVTNYVVAPGVQINSTLPGNRYGTLNGTSMAAPHVAGVVALMLSANNTLTHAQIRSILAQSSTRLN